MRRFSLFKLVIGLPIVLALLLWAYRAHLNSERDAAIESFHRLVSLNLQVNAVQTLDSAFTDQEVIKLLSENLKLGDMLAHDGHVRVAQVVDRSFKPQGSDDFVFCDEVRLYSIYTGGAVIGWASPEGTRIQSIAFLDDGLQITLFGKLQMGSFEYDIPELKAETYVIPWGRREQPDLGSLQDFVWARHKNEVVRNGR